MSGEPGTLFFKDRKVESRISTLEGIKTSWTIFRRALASPEDDYVSVIPVPAKLEAMIDKVCASAAGNSEAFPGVPGIDEQQIYSRLGVSADGFKNVGISNSVFSTGIFLSSIEYPIKNHDLRFASFVITCRDQPGSRLLNAEKRASPALSLLALSTTVTKTSALKDQGSEGVADGLLIKATLRTIDQVSAGKKWFDSDRGAAAFDTNNPEQQKTLASLRRILKNSLNSLHKRLAKLRSHSGLDPVKGVESVMLTDSDINQLSAGFSDGRP